jgi:hypothetical protein
MRAARCLAGSPVLYVLEMNIPIKKTRIVSAMQNFTSGQKGANLHVGKTTQSGVSNHPPLHP